jgi:hypothetical protein
VIEHPGFFLRQDNNPPRPVGEPLEHVVALLTAGIRQVSAFLPAPHGSRVPDPVRNAIVRQLQETFPGHCAFTPSNSANRQRSSKYATSERAGYAASEQRSAG